MRDYAPPVNSSVFLVSKEMQEIPTDNKGLIRFEKIISLKNGKSTSHLVSHVMIKCGKLFVKRRSLI